MDLLPRMKKIAKTDGILRYNSITKKEFFTARNCSIPTYIFVKKSVISDYETFKENNRRLDIKYAHVDDPQILLLIDEIFQKKHGNYIEQYENQDDIINFLRIQWAFLFKESLEVYCNYQKCISESKINAYKYYYWRKNKGLSYKKLSKLTGIHWQKLERLENIKKRDDVTDESSFHNCSVEDIGKIEKALNCPKDLKSGKDNDFNTEYILYYETYKKEDKIKSHTTSTKDLSLIHKAIVFDFDGTLTLKMEPHLGNTTWEKVWVRLGYDVKECARYFKAFRKNEITHEEWCEITAEYFKKAGLKESVINEIAENIILVPKIRETLETLKSLELKLFIVSGSIYQIIERALAEYIDFFDEIKANNMIFNKNGDLACIIGTRYDFEGKAEYIKSIIKKYDLAPESVLYIGNSINDLSAYKSGCNTLCVNPRFVDYENKKHWHDNIPNMTKLTDILDYVRL